MNIDWSKAPVGTTGAMVAEFDGATVKRGDVEWIPSSPTPKERYQTGTGNWVYHEAPTPWNGEGLPPVGAVCEYQSKGWADWIKCEVLGFGAEKVFVRDCEIGEQLASLSSVQFRPFRTPEQIEAEKREAEIEALVRSIISVQGETTRVIAVHLHSVGYRKQVQP